MKKLSAILLILIFTFAFMSNAFACTTWLPETAWAIGNTPHTLNSLPEISANKWGWYIDAPGLESVPATFFVYAGAGQNVYDPDAWIGTVTLYDDGTGHFAALFSPRNGNYVTNIQLGVYDDLDDLIATGGAPGKFTNNVTRQFAKYIVIHFDAWIAQN